MISSTDSVNYLWLDSETTGLDSVKNDVVQLACIAVINGVEQPLTFNEYCQPTSWTHIDPGALAVNGLTLEQLKTFQKPEQMVANLMNFTKKFGVKFTIAGYNVDFDRGFISQLFKKVGKESDFAEIFNSDIRDVFKRVKANKAKFPTANLKLATLATHFNIPINAHDALSDIAATIKLDKIVAEMLGDVESFVQQVAVVDTNLDLQVPAQLHCHSTFSYTDSIPQISEWIEYCVKSGTPAFSLVDHSSAVSLFDMIRIPDVIKKMNKEIKDNKEIVNKVYYKEDGVIGIPGVGLHISHENNLFYLNAWAISDVGYRHLLKLSSLGWLNKINISDVETPVLSLDQVIQMQDGLVFGIPGANGPVASLLMENKQKEAEELVLLLKSTLDIRLELASINVTRHFDGSIAGFRGYSVEGGNIQAVINRFFWSIARKHDIKMVPVSDAHFIDPNDKIIQDCLSKNSFKDARYFSESRHQLNVHEMYAVIKSHIGDEFTEGVWRYLVQNTYDIMNLAKDIKIKFEYHLPKIYIPDDVKAMTDDYQKQTYYLVMKKIKEHGRWDDSPEYKDRFKKEIDVIMKNKTLNFLPYFLVYEDVAAFARSAGFLQNIARGSAGGSLLSYYLKIIHVDPVQHGLPFERFLSHARINAGSFPDIDLDISDVARPIVMKYLQEKYGLGFAQIATFSRMKTKNAIKDSMWALYGRNRKDPEISAICDSIEDSPQGVDEWDFLYGYTDQEDVEHLGEVQKNKMLANFFEQKPEIEKMVKRLIGCIRGWSRHASAFVISTIDLSGDRVPTMMMDDKNLGSILVTQYDANMVEKSGLVKADILGIKTLAVTSDCIALVKKNYGVDLLEEIKGVPYIYRLPEDDGVFGDFYNKDTDSSFQFNTELIKGFAQEFCPLKKVDLHAMTALCRPGALDAPLYDSTAAQFYMDVRNGKQTIKYLHNDLERILKDSNGVFVYQEEVMKFLVEVVGYSWEESDMIRSAIAKKKHEVIMACFDRIRKSCKARGWDDDAVETICQQIQAFSRYSFNKSHSYAYGELGYITLWLKHHYKLEWWSSVLNNEDKEDKTRKYISYLGDTVAPPSLKIPTADFTIRGEKIVAPISVVKGLGTNGPTVKELVAKGPFENLADYVKRIDHSKVNIGAVSALLKARAADDMFEDVGGSYLDKRKKFMADYVKLRGNKTAFREEMLDFDPIKMYMDERDTNKCFNKPLLSDPAILLLLQAKWPGLHATGRKAFPLVMGKEDREVPILGGIKTAESLFKANKIVDKTGNTISFGMILLFGGSSMRGGKSKKTGKDWSCLSVELSDGFNNIEATDWKRNKALRIPKNSIVYVRGELKAGWKTPVALNIVEIEEVK